MIFFTNLGLQQTNMQSVKTIVFRIKILGWSFFFKAIPKCYILTFEWVDILIFLCPYLLPIQFDKLFRPDNWKRKLTVWSPEHKWNILLLPEFLQRHIPKRKHMLAIVLHHHLSGQQSLLQIKTMSIYLPVKKFRVKMSFPSYI